jgi:hypothetical protein
MARNGAMVGASQAASRVAAANAVPSKTIAEKGGKKKDTALQAESDSDNEGPDELEDDASSSSSFVIVRKLHPSDKHTLMSAQQQEEQLLLKTIQPSIDKQKKVTAEKGRDLAEHSTRYPSADHHATDSEHHVIVHLYSQDFPFICASICMH